MPIAQPTISVSHEERGWRTILRSERFIVPLGADGGSAATVESVVHRVDQLIDRPHPGAVRISHRAVTQRSLAQHDARPCDEVVDTHRSLVRTVARAAGEE